jgi:hypothetical protein
MDGDDGERTGKCIAFYGRVTGGLERITKEVFVA